VLKFTRSLMAVLGLLAGSLLLVTAAFGVLSLDFYRAFMLLFLGSLALLLLVAFFHCLTVLVFFARVSLFQILAGVLTLGLLVTVMVKVPGALKLVPGFVLLSGLVGIVITLMQQDPTGERETPRFIRQAMANRVREKIRKRREQQPTGSPEP
jgi:hypothetical protein